MVVVQKIGKSYKYIFKFIVIFSMLILFYCSINNYKIIQKFRPLIRNIENKIVLYKVRNFSKIETDTFVFRYNDIDEETMELIKKTAEDKYKEVANIFKYKPKNKILIIVYNDTDLMMNTTMLKKGDPPIGVYYGNSVHVTNPNLWIKEADKIQYIFYKEGPMLHELVHLFTDHISRGNFPMWFTEGVSLYFEYIVDGYEWGKDIIFTNTNSYTIEELNSNFRSLNQYIAYTKSFRLVKNMVDNYGLNKLIDVITLLGQGHNIDEFIYLFEELNI